MSIIQYSEKEFIIRLLKRKFSELFKTPVFLNSLSTHIENWSTTTERLIWQSDPFIYHQTKWDNWNNLFRERGESLDIKIINDYQELCNLSGTPFDKAFWHNKLKENNEDKKRTSKLLLNEWQKNLDKAQTQWRLEKLEQERRKLLEQLEQWLALIQQINEQLSKFDLDFGIWFDNSLGSLSKQNIEELKRWTSYFSNDKNVQKIADLLGRMRQIEKSTKIETITKAIDVSVPIVDVNSKEEIIGLRLGKDLEYALPSELALMSDSDTSILFDLKYLESKLVCFELQGTTYQEKQTEITVEIESQEDEKLGPMILCVDTSGSMSGTPENIAKALALYLGNKAKSQKRKCFIINFSTSIETFEITATEGITDLISFLQKSFHGGTDAAPALRHALKLLKSEGYEKADVLMISDFVMGELPEQLLKEIKIQRDAGSKFNSLVIGDLFMYKRLKTHFDNEWIYNPHSQQIQELLQFSSDVMKKTSNLHTH